MIHDIAKQWRTSGPWTISLRIVGSLGGSLSRVNHPDGRPEKWIFGQNGEIRELSEEDAAAIVAHEAGLPAEIEEGEVMDSGSARPEDASYTEMMFDAPLSPERILYREGDFLVSIAKMPGQDRYQRFSVMFEIMVSDTDGYYVVCREETQNWTHWPEALRFLMKLAEETISTHARRCDGTLDSYEDFPSCKGPPPAVIADQPQDHEEVIR